MEEKLLPAEEQEAEKNLRFLTKENLNSSSSVKLYAQFDVSFLNNRNTFGKLEKLKSRKSIDILFKEGKSVATNGFTLVYLQQPLNTFYPAQASFSVPKKFFKHAVDRNRIKRMMREAYRLNKILLYKNLAQRKNQLLLMFIYKGKAIPTSANTSSAILSCINRLIKE